MELVPGKALEHTAGRLSGKDLTVRVSPEIHRILRIEEDGASCVAEDHPKALSGRGYGQAGRGETEPG